MKHQVLYFQKFNYYYMYNPKTIKGILEFSEFIFNYPNNKRLIHNNCVFKSKDEQFKIIINFLLGDASPKKFNVIDFQIKIKLNEIDGSTNYIPSQYGFFVESEIYQIYSSVNKCSCVYIESITILENLNILDELNKCVLELCC